MWTRDDYRRRGKWGYIVLASLLAAPVAYGLTRNWGVLVATEVIIVAGGYAGDRAFRSLK